MSSGPTGMRVDLHGLVANCRTAMGKRDTHGWGYTLERLVEHTETLQQQQVELVALLERYVAAGRASPTSVMNAVDRIEPDAKDLLKRIGVSVDRPLDVFRELCHRVVAECEDVFIDPEDMSASWAAIYRDMRAALGLSASVDQTEEPQPEMNP